MWWWSNPRRDRDPGMSPSQADVSPEPGPTIATLWLNTNGKTLAGMAEPGGSANTTSSTPLSPAAHSPASAPLGRSSFTAAAASRRVQTPSSPSVSAVLLTTMVAAAAPPANAPAARPSSKARPRWRIEDLGLDTALLPDASCASVIDGARWLLSTTDGAHREDGHREADPRPGSPGRGGARPPEPAPVARWGVVTTTTSS